MQTCNFHPQHDDIIHDLSYNYYGKRICSASADQYLKVWDMTTGAVVDKDGNEQQHNWELSDSWKAHEAAVLKCCWAHPEFGNVIASCSFDRSIRVWEEVTSAADKNSSNGSGQKWSEVARLVDSRGTVQDIEFAPNHMGLKLATVSVDGALRIYEAMDVINLSHWTLMDEFDVVASAVKERDAEFCLSWCTARYMNPMIVVGCGQENVAKIFHLSDYNPAEASTSRWRLLDCLSGHTDTIHDVAWAPSLGRSYQLIATASKDKYVRIFKLTLALAGDSSAKPAVELIAELSDHASEVWRLEWNITGTVLSSAGADGSVLLWKANYLGEWGLMSSVNE